MTDLLAGVLSSVGFCNEDIMPQGNGIFLQAINISDFLPLEQYIGLVQGLIEWVKSSRRMASVEEILIPGEPEFRMTEQRTEEGIPVEDSV